MEQNAHDKFAKSVFSDTSIFGDLLRQFLPGKIAGQVDYSTLKLLENGHVTEQISEHFSDLVYECRLLDGHPATMLFLMENKTNAPRFPHVQLNKYQQGRWEKAIIEKAKKLPLVIPIVLYHGQRRWPNRPFSASFDQFPDGFEVFLPTLNYILIDLSKFPDGLLLGLQPTPLINALVMLKHCYDSDFLKNHPEIIFIHGPKINNTDHGKFFLNVLVEYFTKMTQLRVCLKI